MTAPLARRATAGRFALSQNHDINVTPFIDVMLVLLIVFIIAAPLATTEIKLDIPAGGVGPNWTPPVAVMIDDRGGITIRSADAVTISTSLDRLSQDLDRASGSAGRGHNWIVVTGSTHTRYGAFMAVIDRLHTDGFTRVRLAAKAA